MKSFSLFALALLAAHASTAQAQFIQRSQNPYGGTTTGFGNIFAPNFGNQNAYSQTSGVNMPFTFSRANSMYAPGNSYAPTSFGWNAGMSPGGYLTGNAYSYNRPVYTGPSSYVRPEGPRKAFDRWALDRDQQLSANEAQRKQEDLKRSLGNPSSGDLSSGIALNAIIDALEGSVDKLKTVHSTAVDGAFLTRLNFTRGSGSVGLLRNGGKIEWPAVYAKLTPADDVAKMQAQVERFLQQAYSQVSETGKGDAEVLKNLALSISSLTELSSAGAKSLTFGENVDVKRFLKSLEDSVAFLKQPDAADWLPGKQKVNPQTVAELAQTMIEKKVRFAPAVVGNDYAYATMHRALVTLYGQVNPVQVGADK